MNKKIVTVAIIGGKKVLGVAIKGAKKIASNKDARNAAAIIGKEAMEKGTKVASDKIKSKKLSKEMILQEKFDEYENQVKELQNEIYEKNIRIEILKEELEIEKEKKQPLTFKERLLGRKK
jgi:hypothetical protein